MTGKARVTEVIGRSDTEYIKDKETGLKKSLLGRSLFFYKYVQDVIWTGFHQRCYRQSPNVL